MRAAPFMQEADRPRTSPATDEPHEPTDEETTGHEDHHQAEAGPDDYGAASAHSGCPQVPWQHGQ